MAYPSRPAERAVDTLTDMSDRIVDFVENNDLMPLLRIVRDGALGMLGLAGVSVMGDRYLFGEESGDAQVEEAQGECLDNPVLKYAMIDNLGRIYTELQRQGFEPVKLATMSSSDSQNFTAGDLQAHSVALADDPLGSAQFYADQAECDPSNQSNTLRAGFFSRSDNVDNKYRDRTETIAFRLPKDMAPDGLGEVLSGFSLEGCTLDEWALLRGQANAIQPSDPSVGRAFAVEMICPCPAS